MFLKPSIFFLPLFVFVLFQNDSYALTETKPILRQTTHRFALMASFGKTVGFRYQDVSLMKFQQELIYYFSPHTRGFHLGLTIGEGFGDQLRWDYDAGYNVSHFMFQLGPRIGYDFSLGFNDAVTLGPVLHLAWSFFRMSSGSQELLSGHAFSVQPGIEAKIIFADRALLYVRALAMDIWLKTPENNYREDRYTRLHYYFVGGIGVTF